MSDERPCPTCNGTGTLPLPGMIALREAIRARRAFYRYDRPLAILLFRAAGFHTDEIALLCGVSRERIRKVEQRRSADGPGA